MSWVRRRAAVTEFICDSCSDLVCLGCTYYRMLDGRVFCEDCPPDDESECLL